jgi:energy-coupling factor transporter ATP-binding protein EcfA2
MTAADVDTVAGLRAWADGVYPLESAVELLVRFQDGRFTQPGWPWIDQADSAWSTLNARDLTGNATACLSGGEQRVLAVVASLAGGGPVDLADAVTGLDRSSVQLVLAAVAHASASHEHADLVIDHDLGASYRRGTLPSLYPWPEPCGDGAGS